MANVAFKSDTIHTIEVALKAAKQHYTVVLKAEPNRGQMCKRELSFLKKTLIAWELRTLKVEVMWRIKYALDDAEEIKAITSEQHRSAIEDIILYLQ